MNYLIYIEHSAENLQFFLWHRDYVQRFTEANTSDMSLAPEWTQTMEDETLAKIQKEGAEKLRKEPEAAAIFKGTDFEKPADSSIENRDPFSTPPRTPGSNPDVPSVFSGSNAVTYRSQASDAFTAAGAKQPCKSLVTNPFVAASAHSAPQSLSSHSEKRLTGSLQHTSQMTRLGS